MEAEDSRVTRQDAGSAGPAGPGQVTVAPPGGRVLSVAKQIAERVLWARVGVQRRLAARRGRPRPLPRPVPACDVLGTSAEWREAVAECRRLGLPLHHDRPKNWDALGAVSTVLERCGTRAAVLDAGSARYSSVLPWLRLYGLTDLVGTNIEFSGSVTRDGVVFRYGDITAMDFPDARFDAVTCMSVIEHGVDVDAFLAEAARVLRPGGVLVVSTDYDQNPPDTSSLSMYGHPVKIFSPADIAELTRIAERHGLHVQGSLEAVTAHAKRPVHWKRIGLDYTFVRLSLVKV